MATKRTRKEKIMCGKNCDITGWVNKDGKKVPVKKKKEKKDEK